MTPSEDILSPLFVVTIVTSLIYCAFITVILAALPRIRFITNVFLQFIIVGIKHTKLYLSQPSRYGKSNPFVWVCFDMNFKD